MYLAVRQFVMALFLHRTERLRAVKGCHFVKH